MRSKPLSTLTLHAMVLGSFLYTIFILGCGLSHECRGNMVEGMVTFFHLGE